jgi:uncharacterized membrane protein
VVLAAVMMPLFLSIVGLAIDASIVLASRRELQSLADGAARAAAARVDARAYRESAGKSLVLDREDATRAAVAYLEERQAGLEGTIMVEPGRVVVQVSRDVPTGFLRLAGIGSVRVGATAPAEPRSGVAPGGR